jgi:16S rRNA G966 N2-methylase RsmD
MEEKLVYSCNPEEIFVPPGRMRKKFDEKKLEELARSLQGVQQIQPGVCYKEEDGSLILVAGERRLKACKLAGVPFSYILREAADKRLLERIELEENLCREDLTLQEELLAKARLLENYQDEFGTPKAGRGGGGFGEKKYAEVLSESIGKTHEDLEIAAFMREISEVAEAKTRSEAKKIIKRIKEDYNRSQLLQKAHLERLEHERKSHAEYLKETGIGELETEGEETFLEEGEREEPSPLVLAIADATSRAHHGRMEDVLPTLEDITFDIVFFDPPWRVGYDTNRKQTGTTGEYADGLLSPSEFKAELRSWLQLIWSRMSENAHLYMFFGIRNETYTDSEAEDDDGLSLGLVYGTLEEVGFTTNRMPLIWYKQGAHSTRNPRIWPGRSYEPIAYARKGSKDLVMFGAPDVLLTPAPSPAIKQNHPSAKHPQIYLDLLKRSAVPGDKVLDPMSGSGMLGVAADVLKHTHALDWRIIEEQEDFYNLGIMNIVKGYSRVVGAVGTPDSLKMAESFEELEPRSEEWTRFWTNNVSKRGAMLKHWRSNDPEGCDVFIKELEERELL